MKFVLDCVLLVITFKYNETLELNIGLYIGIIFLIIMYMYSMFLEVKKISSMFPYLVLHIRTFPLVACCCSTLWVAVKPSVFIMYLFIFINELLFSIIVFFFMILGYFFLHFRNAYLFCLIRTDL
jgi:hypothetical protein